MCTMMTLELSMVLPGLNEMVGWLTHGGGRHVYNAEKKRFARRIEGFVEDQGFSVEGRYWGYIFLDLSMRRDPSNIMGGIKFLEDALQEMGVLKNDGQRDVQGILPIWRVIPGRIGVIVANCRERFSEQELCSLGGVPYV